MDKPTHIENKLKNINIDGVENCNLLCKLIIDYLPTSNCVVREGKEAKPEETTNTEFPNSYSYIDYPEGSYINYRDTSYEATRLVFFRPSRHLIDNERYDFEVNIYHGTFIDNDKDNTRKGMVSHAHYQSNIGRDTYNNDFHFHSNKENEDKHDPSYVPESNNNLVTCILFNIGDHKGTNTNVFFNQFINNQIFKNRDYGNFPIKVKTNPGWSIEDLLPSRRSFFMYEDNDKNNTYLVFDSINSIDKGIVDILKHHTYNYPNENMFLPYHNILYKSNIEVITDEKYKKQIREQIKLLLGIHRTSMRISDPQGTGKDYNRAADKIYRDIQHTSLQDYRLDENKAKKLTEKWSQWGKGKKIEVVLNSDISQDSVEKNIGELKKYREYEFNKELNYLDIFEKKLINNNYDLLSKLEINENYKNIDIFREILYKYNFYVKDVKVKKLNIDKIPLENLGIPKLVTNFKIKDLMAYLNLNLIENKDITVNIVGYDGNYNFFVGDENNIDKGTQLTLNDADVRFKDNLFYVPHVPEDLNNLSQTELVFIKKPLIIQYTIHPIPHRILNTISNDESWSDLKLINDDLKFSDIDDSKNDVILELYRYFIQTNTNLLYGLEQNIFEVESVNFTNDDVKVTYINKDDNTELEEGEEIDSDYIPIYKYFGETSLLHVKTNHKTFRIDDSGTEYNRFDLMKPESLAKFAVLKTINNIDTKVNLIAYDTGKELNTTINGDVCQNWNSHQVHLESNSFWDHFRNIPKFLKEGKSLNQMLFEEKNYIRDGLVRVKEELPEPNTAGDLIIFESHNKCRNPGNRKAGPWCYTKNPNRRWDYCVKPDHSNKMSKIVLYATTLLLIVMSYITIKIIFRKKYFTKFIAALTGGVMGEAGSNSGSSNAK